MKSLVILISGRGSNMQALIEARLPVRIAAVISNRPDAPGLEIAKMHGLKPRYWIKGHIPDARHLMPHWPKQLTLMSRI